MSWHEGHYVGVGSETPATAIKKRYFVNFDSIADDEHFEIETNPIFVPRYSKRSREVYDDYADSSSIINVLRCIWNIPSDVILTIKIISIADAMEKNMQFIAYKHDVNSRKYKFYRVKVIDDERLKKIKMWEEINKAKSSDELSSLIRKYGDDENLLRVYYEQAIKEKYGKKVFIFPYIAKKAWTLGWSIEQVMKEAEE